MRVKWEQSGRRVVFSFEPENSDLTGVQKTRSGNTFSMRQNSCYFEVPDDFDIDKTHPDILALVSIFIIQPFIGETLSLMRPVSRTFAEGYEALTKKKIETVSNSVKPRAFDSGITTLSFSGGVDSTAAAMLLPKNSPLVFVERDDSAYEKKGLYKKDAAVHACEVLKKIGHTVYRVKTDFEFVRDPVGFSLAISSGAAGLLLADYTQSDSLGFGMILESAFGIGDYDFTRPSGTWFKLISLSGLLAYTPTAGISEVGTSMIIEQDEEYRGLAQSCVRGRVDESCKKCMKCFRKSMLELTLNNSSLDSINLSSYLVSREVIKTMGRMPLHHENVYHYILQSYAGKKRFFKTLRKKVLADKEEIVWPEKWYPGSLDFFVPEKYHKQHKKFIDKYLKTMSEDEVNQLESWNRRSLSQSSGLEGLVYKLRHYLFKIELRKAASRPER